MVVLVLILAITLAVISPGSVLAVSALTDAVTEQVAGAEEAHPLLWALELDTGQLEGHSHTKLLNAAEWLHTWAFLGDGAPVAGDEDKFRAAKYKAKDILYYVRTQNPDIPEIYSLLATMNYGIGELLPEDDTKARMALYEEMIELATFCVEKVDPDNAACWHEIGTGIGRASTTRGVAASLFAADDVEDAWKKSLSYKSPKVALNGDPLMNDTRYGLGVFYRMVPDSWIVKLIAGVRGDKALSVQYFREAVAAQPYRLELQKELAVALLCYGDDEDDAAALEEARKLLDTIIAGGFDSKNNRATDKIDKKHAQVLLEKKPGKVCGYSRDGFEDVSDEAVEKMKKQEN